MCGWVDGSDEWMDSLIHSFNTAAVAFLVWISEEGANKDQNAVCP